MKRISATFFRSLLQYSMLMLLGGALTLACAWVGGKVLNDLAARARVEQVSVEWFHEQQMLVLRIEERLRAVSTCSYQENTSELLRRYELERERYVIAVFRFAGGSQYQGVEKTLPQPITKIDCGASYLT